VRAVLMWFSRGRCRVAVAPSHLAAAKRSTRPSSSAGCASSRIQRTRLVEARVCSVHLPPPNQPQNKTTVLPRDICTAGNKPPVYFLKLAPGTESAPRVQKHVIFKGTFKEFINQLFIGKYLISFKVLNTK